MGKKRSTATAPWLPVIHLEQAEKSNPYFRCKLHPQYKARRRPLKCIKCWTIWLESIKRFLDAEVVRYEDRFPK